MMNCKTNFIFQNSQKISGNQNSDLRIRNGLALRYQNLNFQIQQTKHQICQLDEGTTPSN